MPSTTHQAIAQSTAQRRSSTHHGAPDVVATRGQSAGRSVLQEGDPVINVGMWAVIFGYLAVVFVCRFLLWSAKSEGAIHWAVVMMCEDSLSIASISFAFLLSHQIGGTPLTQLLSKHDVLIQETNVEVEVQSDPASEPLKLFYFAL